MTNAEAWFNIALRPRKPEGSLGRTAQDGHLDSHTAPELCDTQQGNTNVYISITLNLIDGMQYEISRLLEEKCELKKKLAYKKFTQVYLERDEEKLMYYTGLASFQVLHL